MQGLGRIYSFSEVLHEGFLRSVKSTYEKKEGTVARVIRVAASFPHFWISWSTLMIRFTRIRGSCVVGSLAWPVRLPAGGGVGVMFRWCCRSCTQLCKYFSGKHEALDVRSSKDESRVSLFCKKENARSCLGLILVYECTILFPSSQGKDLALLFYYKVSIAF